ncbi:PREDICTED: protodermal factor 1 isoform X2 [Tarenaya hassleriana]|uniref:protodermal factor 1 isoform X2 n=1 Tax=Tarenaya hassleriana TaxID=28532 RepID=UPI0008FCED34|nr:PREDICTED: protodermal factor 1 isoform X2 [Tarenaya hassleriana]
MEGTIPVWILAVALLLQQLLVPVLSISYSDDKHYYSPDPHAGTPPSGSHGSPSHGTTPSPSHGTPSHGTPSHGGGYTPTPSTPSNPPSNCGNPPHEPSPSHPSTPPSGGYYTSPPPYGGGSTPPTTPVVVTPPTPVVVSPPTTPIIDPGTPGTPFYPAPLPPITGTCDYWRNHPTLIWGLLGWWGTVGGVFGGTTAPGFSSNMNLLQALSNAHTDGYGALYREGTASWLNSMVNNRFPFTTTQVRDNFVRALSSNKAAATQAHTFKLANEGHLKPRS